MHKQIIFDTDKHEKGSMNTLTIPKIFEIKAAQFPSLPAVISVNDDLSDRRILNYNELNIKANQLAYYLISCGVKPNMLVGICMERSADLIIGLLAILKAGGAYLPIDLSYPQERLKFMLKDADATLILTQKSLSGLIPETQAKIIYQDEFEYSNENALNPDIELSGDDLAYVIYTSGSTGKPNGVMVTHYNVSRLFQSTRQWFNFNENDIWTFFHSYAFDFSVWEIWGALLHGGKVVVVPYLLSRSPESFYDLLLKEKVTVLNQTPSAFYQLMQAEEIKNGTDTLSLRYVIFGGEALNPGALKPWFIKHGDKKPQLINMYGITETTVHVTYRPLTSEDTNSGSVIGIPIPDLRVYLLDENLNEIKPGDSGEIYVGGAGITKGYLNRPELNKIRFIKNPFLPGDNEKLYKTGDLGRLLPDNDIEYLGRIDHQVKIRGFRLEPGEIENSIRSYKGIKDCIVKVHKYSEDVVSIIAYLVTNETISSENLKKYLAQFLPEYMLPNSFIELEKIPLTPNGKADIKSLPVPEQGLKHKTSVNSQINSNETENVIRKIWIELLGYENFGLNDNFFDAGGNSLLMGRLQLRINKVFNENISIVDLFRFPTVSSLAKFVNGKLERTENSEIKSIDKKITTEAEIAIIGMAGKYPGADNIEEFWKNLVNGVESISFFTDDELEYRPKGNLDSEVKFIRARGYLKDADKFDAAFFGFNPKEAAVMDPQHRLFLECAWAALEDAGYCPDKYHGSIGIFAGSSLNTYLIYNVLKDRESAEEMANSYQISDYTTLTGNDNAFLTTKIAYKLGLKGPAINVQTACSTSLVAVEQAYRNLVSGQCDMALAGGVSITFPQKRGYFYVDGSIGSTDGHCKPFDADATGTIFSHGAGIVVMKRLKDAIKDRDSIYAVIKSVAVNNDGSDKAGYMTPSIEGQSEVILKAQKSAGIDPVSIKYVETHGTGTPVGDPIEVASLEKAFRESTKEKQFCGIGSVKSNVGHTDAAAGVTGLIKTALSLYHRLIPPTLHYKNPNPAIDFANSPFYVVDKLIDLSKNERPLRAAVSAFGVGGTNAHAILEEFPFISFSCEEEKDKYLLIVSAKTENSLNNNINALKDYLKNNPDEAINDVAYTLQTGRKEFEWRHFFVADSCMNAAEEILRSGSNKAKINLVDKPHLIFMFPGQGAQYVNMGKGLYLREKVFQETIDQCAEYLKQYLDLDIRNLLYPGNNNEDAAKKLEQTVYTQPALFIVEYALAELILSYGLKPFSMIGHSIGDFTSACLAGVISLQDALKLIALRARLMQNQKSGSMLSVRLNETGVKEFLNEDISLAAVNSPNLVVLSGPTELIKHLSEKLSGLNIENRLLFTSHAYHSRMMEPALEPFGHEIKKIKLNKPSIPFISSMTGTWITDEQATDPEFWTKQIRTTVRFSDGILELRKNNNLVFLELGPGRALSTMASQHQFNGTKQTTITTLTQPNEMTDDKSNLLNAIGKLWTTGLNIDWSVLYKDKKRRKLHLPAYQFDRKSYWIEPSHKEITDSSKVNSEAAKQKRTVRKPKLKTVIQESKMTRREYIVEILKDVLVELSGIKKVDLDGFKSFFELGFDSLFMTQVSLAFQKKFEIKITLRQLIETSPTINSIAEFIDSKLAAGKFEPPRQEFVVEEEGEEIMEEYEETLPIQQRNDTQSASGNINIEKLIQQQLEIMTRQLEILEGNKTGNITVNRVETLKESIHSVHPTVDKKDMIKEDTKEKKVFERFGPYNPVKTSRDGKLTNAQQNYLNKLIQEYTAKTSSSKKLTQEHRAHYSDPRTVSGFLPVWKEMTYQVITNKSYGSKLWDLDGNEYIDVIMGFGQYMFGHNPEFVRSEIEKQLKMGFEIGPQSPIAGEVAKLVCEFTGMDRAAFCVTGSEAVLGAIRAARTVTGKDKIIFFKGDYHGIIDEVLIKTIVDGDQVRTMPIAPGIPKENVQNTIALEYGTEESIKVIEKLLPEIAGIMVEPVQARRPDFQPKEFLQKLRKITEDASIPLIFDEVITGFRTAQGGAQEWFGIKADIGTFGKVIGGGFPIGVIAGKKLYMDSFDGGYWQYGDDSIPEAGVTFFAGTFARHPLSLTACYAVLKYLKSKNGSLQKELNRNAMLLTEELNEFMTSRNVPIKMMSFSSVIYYSYPKDLSYFSLLFYVLRNKGIHILEGFPMFLSESHSEEDIRKIVTAFKESIIELQDNGFFPAPLGSDNSKSVKHFTEVPIMSNRFPLSEAQKEMWIGAQMRPEAAGPHHACTGLYLYGALEIEILKKSILAVVSKHEGLRCTISEDGADAILHSEFSQEIPLIDLSSYSGEQQEKMVNEVFHKEAQRFLDLSTGPLVEFRILKLSPEKHLLILTAQMIICDGWSHYVFFEDLSTFYSAFVNNIEPQLQPAVSMREYAVWEKSNSGSAEEKACEKFWLSQFNTIPDPIDLPSSRVRLPLRSYKGDRRTITISEELYRRIKQTGVEQKSSTFAILFAAFYVWLYRLCESKDLVIGVPFAAQSPNGMDRLIGQCANTLPLRVKLESGESFSNVIRKTWDTLLDTQENWNFSYGRLISKLNIQPDPSRIPLVSILFNIDPPMDKVNFSGLKHKFVTGPRYYFQYDLGFNLVEDEKIVNVECDFNRDLFDGNIIANWAEGYISILESITKNPDLPISEIPIALQHVRNESNQPKIIDESDFLEKFRKCVNNSPANIALKSDDDSMTYSYLENYSNRLSNYLISKGVKSETIVAIYLNRTLNLPAAILAVIKSGGAYLLLDAEKPVEQIKNIVEKYNIDFILTDEKLYPTINGKFNHTIQINYKSGEFQYTDSSTDIPKRIKSLFCLIPADNDYTNLIELHDRSVLHTLSALQSDISLNNEDVVLYHSSYTSGNDHIELLLPLISGAQVFLYHGSVSHKIEILQSIINNHRITALLFTPSIWSKLLDSDLNLSNVTKAFSSGEYLKPDLKVKLASTFKDIWNLYGTAETGIVSASVKINPDSNGNIFCTNQPFEKKLILTDENLFPVPLYKPGEILISGSGIACGYYKNQTLTSQKFPQISLSGSAPQRFFRTGDRGRYISADEIELLSSNTNKIKIKNFHFESSDIEKILLENTLVKSAYLIQKNNLIGEKLYTAYIILKNENTLGSSQEAVKMLRRFLKNRIPEYMIPHHFVIIKDIPLNSKDKFDYESLPLPTENEVSYNDYVGPRNKTENKLVDIWKELLSLKEVSVSDSFFDLGGQSLLAVRLFNRIEEEFGQRFPLALLLKAPTIEELALRLNNEKIETNEWPSLIPIQPRGKNKPLYIMHGAGGNVLRYKALSKLLEPDFPVYGLQSQGLDGISKPLNTVEEMAERYLSEIMKMQPKGPYYLAGYCLGGTIAYEMAQRLLKMGEKVGIVAMLDTYNFIKAEKVSFTKFMFEKFQFHAKNFIQLKPSEMFRYFKEKKRLADDGGWANIKTEMPGTTLVDNFGRAESGIELTVQTINDHAGDIYIPKPYDGKITLFKPQKNYSIYPDPKMGWGDLVKDLDIIELPINPHAMLVDPYVELLAAELKKRLMS